MIRSVVPETGGGMTISKYLSRAFPLLPGFCVRNALKKKDVRINGARVSADETVWAGDEICVYTEKKYEPKPLSVVFEDEALAAFIKKFTCNIGQDCCRKLLWVTNLEFITKVSLTS